MIHYSGPLSPKPGRIVCDVVSAQAASQTWHATDCSKCKIALNGLVVELVGDPATRGVASWHPIDPYFVRLAWSDTAGGDFADDERIGFADFDQRWQVPA